MESARRAVFLDRDGTLLTNRVYVADPDDVILVPGTVSALRSLRDAGFALVVVTNQSGIGSGLYSEHAYRAVAARLDDLLGDAGVPLDATEYCPHDRERDGACTCRKPGTGMHMAAAAALRLDLRGSWYVGDKVADVLPAATLGGKGILVRTGFGQEQEADLPPGFDVRDDLAAATRLIVSGSSVGRG